jgi:hypothetical protein
LIETETSLWRTVKKDKSIPNKQPKHQLKRQIGHPPRNELPPEMEPRLETFKWETLLKMWYPTRL